MADFQMGIAPFLGVFLLAHGWQPGLVGTVMTIGGIAGMIMSIPAGAVIDSTRYKRAAIILPGACIIAASTIILISQNFWVVAASQVATAIAGATVLPAINAITLGIVRQKGFLKQNGQNQSFNHAGNMVGAALSGLIGWKFGFTAVFILAALFGLFSLISVMMISARSIDYNAARGMAEDHDGSEPKRVTVLLGNRPLIVLAISLAAFQLGNGGLLPLYNMAVVSHSDTNGPLFVSITMVIAQATMIGSAILATRLAKAEGYWLVLFLSFFALPIRAVLAAMSYATWGVVPMQLLDGLGSGLLGVAISGLVARILNGTGHINVGQGAVMTVQGIGAALSPALGGWIAEVFGYQVAFLTMGCFAAVSIVAWIWFRRAIQTAETNQRDATLRKRGRMIPLVIKNLRDKAEIKSARSVARRSRWRLRRAHH